MLKIYISDLAGYNSGRLRGRFITLPMEEIELEASIKEILKYGEEYFITDYEFEAIELFKVEEYSNPYELNRKIALIEESIEPYQHKSVKVLLENGLASSLEDAIEKIDELIIHSDCSSMAEIAEQYIEEYTDLNGYHPLIVNHIDYEGIGRDLEIEGSFFREGSDIFEFIG